MIVIENVTRSEYLQPISFNSEKELEDVVQNYPQLLMREGDAALSLISQQIQMSSGIMDLMMIDRDGLPVGVEVKLGRNAQARREIVGQLVDYVSVLTEYTVDELDDLVGGKVAEAVDAMTQEPNEGKKIWQAVGANLRAGLARYILVLDDVPYELVRIVRFLALRSNLDIRLVQISKYVAQSGQIFYVPKNYVEEGESGAEKLTGIGSTISERLQAVIDAYKNIAGVYPLRGRAARYRQILPNGWPPSVHYEFLDRAKSVQVEIHLEGTTVNRLAALLQGWCQEPPQGFKYNLIWDPDWYKSGKITAELPLGSTATEIAQAMRDLIAATEGAIAKALQSLPEE